MNERLKLVQQAVTDERWKWQEGMYVLPVEEGRSSLRVTVSGVMYLSIRPGEYVPDLNDAGTAGIFVSWLGRGWTIDITSDGFTVRSQVVGGPVESGKTLAEAALRAWLATGKGN